MGKHILSLNIPLVSNEGILVIEDTSIYDPLLKVDCPTLQVQYPGGNSPILIDVQEGFRAILNACSLGMASAGQCSDSCPCLPDGIYDIRYSVSPHDRVYVEYSHLRITKALNTWNNLLCRLNLQCCVPDTNMEYMLKELYIIRMYLYSAVASVENCHEPQEGMNLYRFAVELMTKLSYKKPYC